MEGGERGKKQSGDSYIEPTVEEKERREGEHLKKHRERGKRRVAVLP